MSEKSGQIKINKNYPVIDMHGTGRMIKQIMQEQKMTVKDVQKFLGLSTPQSIYHWFDGRNLPTLDNLYALSQLFHLPVDALIKGNRKNQYFYTENITYKRLRLYYERIQAA